MSTVSDQFQRHQRRLLAVAIALGAISLTAYLASEHVTNRDERIISAIDRQHIMQKQADVMASQKEILDVLQRIEARMEKHQ